MENSLANKKPWLVAEWSERNGSISPDDVPYGSKKLNAYRLNTASHNILRKSDLLDR